MFAVETMGYSTKIYSRIGELMQGVLPDASAFLVSGLPSRRWYSEATIEEGRAFAGGRPGSVGAFADLPPKAAQALGLLLRDSGQVLPPGVGVRLVSNVPRGKGLSSSSTDVLSVISVVNDYLGIGLDVDGLYRIAARVEPTDPCMSEDILVFFQDRGERGTVIELPPMDLLYFDAMPGRQIDTVGMIRRGAGEWLLQRFLRAASAGDHEILFDCVSLSAEYNQAVLPLPGFEDYRRMASAFGAGLMVAHSGTMAGMLVRPERAAELRQRLDGLVDGPVYLEHYFSPSYTSSVCRPCPVP
jgi:L-threonine kinase